MSTVVQCDGCQKTTETDLPDRHWLRARVEKDNGNLIVDGDFCSAACVMRAVEHAAGRWDAS